MVEQVEKIGFVLRDCDFSVFVITILMYTMSILLQVKLEVIMVHAPIQSKANQLNRLRNSLKQGFWVTRGTAAV